MRILFDHNVAAPLKSFIPSSHSVTKAKEAGWDRLSNGDLLAAAEAAGFDLFITADQNLAYQQNLNSRKVAVIVLGNGQWPILQPHVQLIIDAINAAKPGGFSIVDIPR